MGVKIFTDQINKFIKDIATRRLEIAGHAGVAEARRLVPVLTGQLRDSIGVEIRQDGFYITIYADADYASIIEFGSTTHTAQPYLRPAMMVASKVLTGRGSVAIATPNAPGGFGAFE